MEIHDIPITESELNLLFRKMDADQDKLITYSDFVVTFIPKTMQNAN